MYQLYALVFIQILTAALIFIMGIEFGTFFGHAEGLADCAAAIGGTYETRNQSEYPQAD